jgi:hypothetical protein
VLDHVVFPIDDVLVVSFFSLGANIIQNCINRLFFPRGKGKDKKVELEQMSKLLAFVFLTCCAVAAASAASTKRGLGVGPSVSNRTAYSALKPAWYYDWGLHGAPVMAGSGLPFTPMFWGTGCLHTPDTPHCGGPINATATHVLGFNEPDFSHQANMTVSAAVAAWPLLVKAAASRLIGSPAVAGNPVTGAWLPRFMASVGSTVSFTTLHWYKGTDSQLFISDVNSLIEAYGKPVWVTEFAAQFQAEAEKDPFRYSYEEVGRFLTAVLLFMEDNPMVHRYAWHDAGVGSSALFFENGTATPTGISYGCI